MEKDPQGSGDARKQMPGDGQGPRPVMSKANSYK